MPIHPTTQATDNGTSPAPEGQQGNHMTLSQYLDDPPEMVETTFPKEHLRLQKMITVKHKYQ
jgi:hypothetical protein